MDQQPEWSTIFTPTARKDLPRFRSVMRHLVKKIATLELDPDAGTELVGRLRGARALKFSLPGMGECRVAYIKLPDNRICLLFIASTRENFYEEAERRYEAVLRRGVDAFLSQPDDL